MRPTRAICALAAVALSLTGIGLAAPAAQAVAGSDRLFWIADTGGGNTLWGGDALSVSTAASLPAGAPLTGTSRPLASDGTYLYLCDGTDLIRTNLDGTGRVTVVAGTGGVEAIVVSAGMLYYTQWALGVSVVSASAVNGTPALILIGDSPGSGWDGLAVSGTAIFAVNYFEGLYSATLNGSNPVTGQTVNTNIDITGAGITRLLADGARLYAATSTGQIAYTSDASLPRSSWSTMLLIGCPVSSLGQQGSTLYAGCAGGGIGAIGTDGSNPRILTDPGQFSDVWGVVGLPSLPFQLDPTFSTPVSTKDGFTVNVTNWDPRWDWLPVVSAGTVAAGTPNGSMLPLTVRGLPANAAATVTVSTDRAGYPTGSAEVTGRSSAASGKKRQHLPAGVALPSQERLGKALRLHDAYVVLKESAVTDAGKRVRVGIRCDQRVTRTAPSGDVLPTCVVTRAADGGVTLRVSPHQCLSIRITLSAAETAGYLRFRSTRVYDVCVR